MMYVLCGWVRFCLFLGLGPPLNVVFGTLDSTDMFEQDPQQLLLASGW